MNAHRRRSPSRDRYSDSSPSGERPRTRTYKDPSDSYSTDYSDDFEHDSRSRSITPPRTRIRREKKPPTKRLNPYSSDRSSTIQLHSSAASKKSTQSVGRRGLRQSKKSSGSRKQGWRSHSFSKEKTIHLSPKDNISSRMLSAKQRKIHEIENELFETKQRLDVLQKENRLLKTLQHRQDKALRRFEDEENDLPRLITQNAEDQRVLKARLRKTQEAERTLEGKLRENNDEMQKMEGMLRRLKKIVYDKNLGERSELARQLTNTENNLSVAERKIKELDKKLELTVSSFTRQINSERLKHKETKEKLAALHEEYVNVKARLKEKERALDVSNIYSLRKKEGTEKALVPSSTVSPRRLEEKLASSATQTDLYLTSPITSTQTVVSTNHNMEQSLVLAGKLASPGSKKKKNSPREHLESTPDFRKTIKSPIFTTPKSPTFPEMSSEPKSEPTLGSNGVHLNKGGTGGIQSKQSVFLTANFESPLSSPNTSFITDSGDKVKQSNPGTTVVDQNHKQDGFDALLEETRKQKNLEAEKRQQEVQKKKAKLLAKMREIEDDKTPVAPVAITKNKPGPVPKTVNMHPQSKAELVKSLLGNETDEVVENLHLGIPSSLDGNNKKPEKPEREISFGSYAPTVGGAPIRRKARPLNKVSKTVSSESESDDPIFDLNSGKQNKKSDLLAQLFGNPEKQNGTVSNEALSPSSSFLKDSVTPNQGKTLTTNKDITPRAKPIHSGYPWEKNVVTTGNLQGNGDSSNLSNKVKDSSQLLKAVSSVNDDEIEELTL